MWNLGSGVQTTLEDLVTISRSVFDVSEEPVWGSMENRVWDTDRWLADAGRARTDLGWCAVTPLAAGLQAMGDWMSSAPERMRYR